MRVSPSSLGSQSWVGCDQGHTGGVGGGGAQNWCVGGVISKMRQGLGGLNRCGRSIVGLARICNLQSAFISSLERIIDMQVEITMQVKGRGDIIFIVRCIRHHGKKIILTNISNA